MKEKHKKGKVEADRSVDVVENSPEAEDSLRKQKNEKRVVSLDINDKSHIKICFQKKPRGFFTFCVLTRLDVLGRREETHGRTLKAQKSPNRVRQSHATLQGDGDEYTGL